MNKKQKVEIYSWYQKLKVNYETNPTDIKTMLDCYKELKEKVSLVQTGILNLLEKEHLKGGK